MSKMIEKEKGRLVPPISEAEANVRRTPSEETTSDKFPWKRKDSGDSSGTIDPFSPKPPKPAPAESVPDRKSRASKPPRKGRRRWLLPGAIAGVVALLVIGYFTVHFWEPGTTGEFERCKLCGTARSTADMCPTGHAQTELDHVKEASCTEAGYTGDLHCLDCGIVLKLGEVTDSYECASSRFSDVHTDQWYHAYVDYVVSEGLMNGVNDTQFLPGGDASRGAVVTALYNLAGAPEVTGTNNFTDLQDDWYADAVQWAVNIGLTHGVSDTTFDPKASITREQLAVMLYRLAQHQERDVSAQAQLIVYNDAMSISKYAIDALSWASATGVIVGVTESTMEPGTTCTRAQLATILARYARGE